MKEIAVAIIFVYLLTGCDQVSTASHDEASKDLANKSISNMISVKGGEFLMGDFGPLVDEKLPFSINQDDKNLHKVILSDFAISKFKVTNDDYIKYLNATGTPPPPKNILTEDYPSLSKGNYSASVIWQRAKDYCLWLGKVSGRKIDLPTEAQWEYAARSRGQYLPFATQNGQFNRGANIPSQDEIDAYTDGFGFPAYPIGKYPPNPLGLYDMGLSGSEWTNDWYASDYYTHSPEKDPQGPSQGKEKVLRGYVGGDRQYALTMFRQSSPLIPKIGGRDNYEKYGISPLYVFRCVINN